MIRASYILTLFCNNTLQRLHIYSKHNELYLLTLHSVLHDRNRLMLSYNVRVRSKRLRTCLYDSLLSTRPPFESWRDL